MRVEGVTAGCCQLRGRNLMKTNPHLEIQNSATVTERNLFFPLLLTFGVCFKFLSLFFPVLCMSVFLSARIRLTLIWLRFSCPRSKLTQILSPSPVHGPAPGRSLGRSRTSRPAPTRPPRPRPCSRSLEQPPTSSQTSAC